MRKRAETRRRGLSPLFVQASGVAAQVREEPSRARTRGTVPAAGVRDGRCHLPLPTGRSPGPGDVFDSKSDENTGRRAATYRS